MNKAASLGKPEALGSEGLLIVGPRLTKHRWVVKKKFLASLLLQNTLFLCNWVEMVLEGTIIRMNARGPAETTVS